VKTIAAMTKSFVNLLYPLHCAICEKSLPAADERGVCAFCAGQIRPNPKPHCASCGRSLQGAKGTCADCRKTPLHFTRAYSACLYEGATKELIHLFKYGNRRDLSKLLTGLLIDFIKDDRGIIDGITAVTFVPLHKKRLRERDFNQSEILASGIAKEFGISLVDVLEKIVSTRNQNELSREERLVNLQDAFDIKDTAKNYLQSSRILLIDDVMTTGATLDEASRVLLELGTAEVRCLTLARGI